MDDLDRIKSNNGLSVRRNEAARFAADQALGGGGSFLEPSLKDKLIGDQVRINNLKMQQK
jgi:hypothetical protein